MLETQGPAAMLENDDGQPEMAERPNVLAVFRDRRKRDTLPREVYFIRGVIVGLIKIGVSDSARGRVFDLQVGSPDRLEVVGTIKCSGARRLERELHERFAHLRQHGEWFLPGDDLLAFIATETDEGRLMVEEERRRLDDEAWARVEDIAQITAFDYRGRVSDAAINEAIFEQFGMDADFDSGRIVGATVSTETARKVVGLVAKRRRRS